MKVTDDFIDDTLTRIDRLIDVIEHRAGEMSGKAKSIPFKDSFGRGHYSGYAAASRMDAEILKSLRNRLAEDYTPDPTEEIAA